jgi:2-hydroxychromene-2-carboxylate isomerase
LEQETALSTSKTLEFFFDFLSPFAYLTHQKLPALAKRYGYELRFVAIDLQKAKLAAGNNGPSNRQVPAKLRYLTADMNRWAQRYGVPLKFPRTFASERMNKGLLFAQDRGRALDYVSAGFACAWGRGGEDLADPALLASIARELGWPDSEFLAFVDSPGAAERFEDLNVEAHRRGVFGVPTMLIGEEMWWGNDRLHFLEEFLKQKSVQAA